MHPVKDFLFENIRRAVFKFQESKKGRWYAQTNEYVTSGIDPNRFLFDVLQNSAPLMLSRLGTSELHVILNLLSRNQPLLTKYRRYFRGSYPDFWWGQYVKDDIAQNSGFFPVDDASLEAFVKLYLSILPEIDILLSWLTGERHLDDRGYLKNSRTNLYLYECEPYFYEEPWTKSLKGKKVLVVHPFTDSIVHQYQKRTLLFKQEVLPEFELVTVKAVQSIKGHSSGFATWFDALLFMQNKIAAQDFDIALIAAGSYGLPLAAYVKSIGKQALHLGGFLQQIFGIRGNRWELSDRHRSLINEHWKFPYEHEHPSNYQKLDHGSYW